MTTTRTFTKGPYEINEAGLIYGQVSGDENEAPFVADVCHSPLDCTDQEKATGHLLAASWDMLKALELCEDVLAELARLDDGTPSISALHAVRAAIAKTKWRATTATNRPGDQAAIMHEETGIPYERCLVMCNID